MADFLDKMKGRLEKGLSTLGTKSKELLDSNRVKLQISGLEQQKKSGLAELGSLVCSMLEAANLDPEVLNIRRSRIASIDEQIKRKHEELIIIHAQAQDALLAARSGEV